MVLLVFHVFLSSEEVEFQDVPALHFAVEFRAWDREMTCSSPASVEALHPL